MTTERPARVGLICDYAEERWPSMDLAGAMIAGHLRAEHADAFEVVAPRPPYRHRVGRWPWPGRLAGAARNADRLLNRFLDYPAALRRAARRGGCDLYH